MKKWIAALALTLSVTALAQAYDESNVINYNGTIVGVIRGSKTYVSEEANMASPRDLVVAVDEMNRCCISYRLATHDTSILFNELDRKKLAQIMDKAVEWARVAREHKASTVKTVGVTPKRIKVVFQAQPQGDEVAPAIVLSWPYITPDGITLSGKAALSEDQAREFAEYLKAIPGKAQKARADAKRDAELFK